MAVFRMIIVARPIKISRHHTAIIGTVLAIIGFAQFDPGNLGNRIGFVGRLQLASEQRNLHHGLCASLDRYN